MFKNIAVGTDGSSTADKAVAAAAELARQWGAKLHVVTAQRPPTTGMADLAGVPSPLDPWGEHALSQEVAIEVGQRAIDTWATGITADLYGVVGNPAQAICDVATEVGADLVVVGSKGMHRRVLGSVPNSVSHNAPCAVLIVKTD